MKISLGIFKSLAIGIRSIFRKPITKDLDKIEQPKNSRASFKIRHEKCISCKLCMKVCPCKAVKLHGLKPSIDQDICSNCDICFRVCPVKAISKNR